MFWDFRGGLGRAKQSFHSLFLFHLLKAGDARDVGKSGINEDAFLHLWYRDGTPSLRTCSCKTVDKLFQYVVSFSRTSFSFYFRIDLTWSELIYFQLVLCRYYSWPSINIHACFSPKLEFTWLMASHKSVTSDTLFIIRRWGIIESRLRDLSSVCLWFEQFPKKNWDWHTLTYAGGMQMLTCRSHAANQRIAGSFQLQLRAKRSCFCMMVHMFMCSNISNHVSPTLQSAKVSNHDPNK